MRPGCPCTPDYPHTATDKHAFYISDNEYTLDTNTFNGPLIYALSKKLLIGSPSKPPPISFPVTLFHGFPSVNEDTSAFTLMPAKIPPGGKYASSSDQGDIQYFVSSDIPDTLSNHLSIWALTETQTLGTLNPECSNRAQVKRAFLETQTFAFPSPAVQKDGFRPLGESLGEPLELLDTNDNSVQEPMFVDNKLWIALNSGVNDVVGIAYFVVSPTGSSSTSLNDSPHLCEARLDHQGFITVNNTYLMFPAFGVNSKGQAIIGFSFSGPEWFPSVGYVKLNQHGRASNVRLVVAGEAPEDGFTGYQFFGGNGVARWGDYSTAAVHDDGSIWFMTQYIPSNTTRSELANWGMFIARVQV